MHKIYWKRFLNFDTKAEFCPLLFLGILPYNNTILADFCPYPKEEEKMAKNPSGKLTPVHIFGYFCGDCGGVITLYMLSGYISRFMQVQLEVNAGILSAMLLVWNIWDAMNDPMMGTIMDKAFAKAKPGADKFRPWILRSIPIMFVGLISFYVVPAHVGGGVAMLVSAFILKIVYEGGYTMMNIGMGSLLGNMAKNDQERATLASARGFGSTIGGMIGGFVIPQILNAVGETTTGYAVAAVASATLGCIFVFLHFALTEERNKEDPAVLAAKTEEEKEKEKVKLSDILTIVKTNRAFLALVVHSISICAIQALGQGGATYMYFDVLKNISIQSYVSIMSSVTMVCILIVAPILTKKWDLVTIIRTCLIAGFVLFVGLMAYAFMVEQMNAWVFAIWNALATAMITMSVQMQWGLVADAIDYNEYLTGKRNEGTIYGFFSLSRRVGSTIANSATVLLIAAIGYDAALAKAGGVQSDGTITGIKLMVIGFPMIAALISWFCFKFVWCINDDVRAKMAAWKAEKKAKADAIIAAAND